MRCPTPVHGKLLHGFDILRRAVGDGADVPVGAAAAGGDDVVADATLEGAGFVPRAGHGAKELEALRFPQVGGGRVGEHLERAFGLNAEDFKKATHTVTRATKFPIKLAEGGGWAARMV
jgi:hypothetical protein